MPCAKRAEITYQPRRQLGHRLAAVSRSVSPGVAGKGTTVPPFAVSVGPSFSEKLNNM
jgi:hypothetical protein